jgi:hypothetical protein
LARTLVGPATAAHEVLEDGASVLSRGESRWSIEVVAEEQGVRRLTQPGLFNGSSLTGPSSAIVWVTLP